MGCQAMKPTITIGKITLTLDPSGAYYGCHGDTHLDVVQIGTRWRGRAEHGGSVELGTDRTPRGAGLRALEGMQRYAERTAIRWRAVSDAIANALGEP